MNFPPITVGVVTHSGSFVDFNSFLIELCPALALYRGECQLVIVNNSGEHAVSSTQSAVQNTSIDQHCDCLVVASEENNIAVGRNTVIHHARYDLVALIDDDEFPVPDWLNRLVDTLLTHQCGVVAGPAIPIYLFDTPNWIRHIDLHRAQGKLTGIAITNCPTANVLIDKTKVVGDWFNRHYGITGGEDSEFFLRQSDANVDMRWCNEAEVYEYIPAPKSTSRYMMKRSILQGNLNRRILTDRGEIPSQAAFVIRSAAVSMLSLVIGGFFLIIKHPKSGHWLQRAFGNLGHCLSLRAKLYPHA